LSLYLAALIPVLSAQEPLKSQTESQARKLLDDAKAKLLGIRSLTVDFESNHDPVRFFDKTAEIVLERPNKFAITDVSGAFVAERKLRAVSDGQKVTRMDEKNYIAYDKPVHAESFFLGQNFLVQFFFDSRPISFDPSDETWGRPVSVYDTNVSAYDRDVKMAYLGTRTLEDVAYEVVEIKYNTARQDTRQQVYIGPDKLVSQVDTYFDGILYSQKFRNYRIDPVLPPDTFKLVKADKMPLVDSDPVRMGASAPDFKLPNYANGGPELSMKELLKDKKGMMVCVLDGEKGLLLHNADVHLAQMRVLQELKDKFEKQGLVVVCIVGGPKITPDLTDEMKLNWMPDVTRFNYPIAVDVDIERGIQGSAFENLQLNGRNNLLLDKDGRVVYASQNFTDKVNQLALYQALAQIGFAVSAADLDSAAR